MLVTSCALPFLSMHLPVTFAFMLDVEWEDFAAMHDPPPHELKPYRAKGWIETCTADEASDVGTISVLMPHELINTETHIYDGRTAGRQGNKCGDRRDRT